MIEGIFLKYLRYIQTYAFRWNILKYLIILAWYISVEHIFKEMISTFLYYRKVYKFHHKIFRWSIKTKSMFLKNCISLKLIYRKSYNTYYLAKKQLLYWYYNCTVMKHNTSMKRDIKQSIRLLKMVSIYLWAKAH